MRIVVVGGGTAGAMAAVSLSSAFRETTGHELLHIHDPDTPTIGVGEGTWPSFLQWIDNHAGGIAESDLCSRCGITRKYGVQFEGWGERGNPFIHHFFPVREGYAYHVAADRLLPWLSEHSDASIIEKRVASIRNEPTRAVIEFDEDDPLTADFVFDARGFGGIDDDPDSVTSVGSLGTDSAIIQASSVTTTDTVTRSIARPHGWVFVIPLQHRTSYGYVFNSRVSTDAEVHADLKSLLDEEEAVSSGPPRRIRFPSFVSNSIFHGSVWKIGNTASFLEPLEATAIGITTIQIQLALAYPLGAWRDLWARRSLASAVELENIARNVRKLDDRMRRCIHECAAFLSWHYAHGSIHDTPFWIDAIERYRHLRQDPDAVEVASGLDACLDKARAEPVDSLIRGPEEGLGHLGSNLFGVFPHESFVLLDRGLRGVGN